MAESQEIFRRSQAFSSDIEHITKLAANLLEAHTAAVFLPQDLLVSIVSDNKTGNKELLEPVAVHTLAPTYADLKTLRSDAGLIGWVSKNKKSIHVSPFERDSRVLGIYKEDLQLKSFLGVPVLIQDHNEICGVLIADSKKAFAFSKLQGKLLEDLAQQVSRTISLYRDKTSLKEVKKEYSQFIQKGEKLIQTMGPAEIAALRIRVSNISECEKQIGTGETLKLIDQVYRLITQAIPPHCPICITITGEIICLIDSMTTDLYTNKILAITEYTKIQGRTLQVEFRARSIGKTEKFISLENLVTQTHFEETIRSTNNGIQINQDNYQSQIKRVISFR